MTRPDLVAISAIIGIVVLLSVALWRGMDGGLLAGGLAIIGGLGGYGVKTVVDKLSPGK